MEDEIKKAFDEINRKLAALEQLLEEVSSIRAVMEGGRNLIPRFVESSPNIRTFGQMINNIVNPHQEERLDTDLYYMGYFDQAMLDTLLPVARYIRIISPSGALTNRRNKDALTRISKAGAQVRTHPMLHARIFCVPDRRYLIIGSGDLQTDCIGGTRFDAGVYSNYPELIKSATDFFNRVWEESDSLV